MPLTVQVVNPLERADWNARLRQAGDESFFHTRHWAAALCCAYGFRPRYLVAEEGDLWQGLLPIVETPAGLWRRKGVSLPFTDRCEWFTSDAAVAARLWTAALAVAQERRWLSLELRGGTPPPGGGDRPSRRYLQHRVTLLPDSRQMFDLLPGTTRTAIRKAQRHGLRVEWAADLEAVRRFYRLHCLTRRRHGLPPPPFSFFRRLAEQALAQDLGGVALAYWGEQPVAGAVFLHFGGTAHFKFGASHPRFLEWRPNNLVMWEALRRYGERGLRWLELGRTNIEHDGLRRFKQGWGAKESELRYFEYDLRQADYVVRKDRVVGAHNAVFRRLPIPLARIVGAWLYRYAA